MNAADSNQPDAAGRTPPAPAMPSACASGGCGCATGAGGARNVTPIRVERRAGVRGPVRVNGVEISAAAIAEEAQQHPAPSPEEAWTAAARALVVRSLLLDEARRLGIPAVPESDEAGRVETEEEALIRALLEREAAPPCPTQAECERFYAAQRERFTTPELLEAAHILVPSASAHASGWAAAEAQARRIAAEIGDDRLAFAAAARVASQCPTAQQGGSLGQVRRGELVAEVDDALHAMPEGATRREPVRSRFGWHVLRLERRIPGRTLPFELVRDRIADLLEARAWVTRGARYAAQLAERAHVEGVALAPAGALMELA